MCDCDCEKDRNCCMKCLRADNSRLRHAIDKLRLYHAILLELIPMKTKQRYEQANDIRLSAT